jgi:5-methyltetrahydrofolate--homocysteine methyltransferase
MVEMEGVVRALRAAFERPPRIIIGGAPISQAYADTIGADGYGRDAATGAEVAKKLCGVGA